MQAFAAHKGEITSMVAGPGHKYIVTGGVDFQVRVEQGGLGGADAAPQFCLSDTVLWLQLARK